jgi:phosphoserine phosphatase
MGALHVFDLDGTLLPATTASLELAKVTGHLDELHALESRFRAGELDTKGFASAVHELWSDLTAAQVSEAFAAARRLGRVTDVFADLRARGERSVVITMSPDFFVDELVALGTDEVLASRFPPVPFAGVLLDPTGILTPDDKPRLVRERLAALDLPVERCVAYGDSMSDAPLFRVLRHTVAVNADDHLLELAAARYDGDDLWPAYELGRGLLDG